MELADMEDDCCSTQLIDVNGVYNVFAMENFMKNVKFGECGLSYVVVSIIGKQSTGKSTLLNHLFKTNFREMDALKGRSWTTQGIWLARCVGIEPFTIVLDLEGSDAEERREDDNAFEKQSALFALAVSDIVLINMWDHSIGLEHGASRPLLKNIFQAMIRLFSPRKTTLLFVIREKSKISLEFLKGYLRNDIQKIWDSLHKLEHKDTPLSDFFNVEVVALSSFVHKEEQFKEEVANLRESFFHSTAPGGLAGDRHGVIPASRFSLSAQQIWKAIKEYTYFEPSYRVLVASFRCDRIVDAKIASFTNIKEWREIEEPVQNGIVIDFGKKLNSTLDDCMTSFDIETECSGNNIRTSWRKFLKSKLLKLVEPTHRALLGHIRSRIFEDFKWAFEKALERGDDFDVALHDCSQSFMFKFDEECKGAEYKLDNWDTYNARNNILRDIEEYATSVHAAKFSKTTSLLWEKLKLNKALLEPMEAVLESATAGDKLGAIRSRLQWDSKIAVQDFSSALSSLSIDEKPEEKVVTKLD